MLEFLENYGGSIAVGLILLAVVALVVIKQIKDKRAGRHSCGGDCSHCGCCPHCADITESSKKN